MAKRVLNDEVLDPADCEGRRGIVEFGEAVKANGVGLGVVLLLTIHQPWCLGVGVMRVGL